VSHPAVVQVLLATKLFVPRPSSRVVRRARLLDRLDQAGQSAVTLVSAPAGFGKTALVSGWIRERGSPAAWLSLDEDDDDPARFWSYLIAALRSVDVRLGASALRLIESGRLPPARTIATSLINDLAGTADRVVCVLDDYHAVAAAPINEGVTFLVEHLPPNASLVVTTRADPSWPLARLRASGRMTELRAADLRFTDAEARAFLESAGLRLSADEIDALESRTEGWIAGLQMAALSMQDRPDAAGFIRDFAGSHRFVLDYLAEEVLARQPEETRAFLVRTSILERLQRDLCEEVTGIEGSQKILESLEQANLFTEPLDDERRWYRYHQLFADVLRSQLQELDAERVPELHRRASGWFELNGLDEEAVHHALEGGDVERAASLIARTAAATFVVGKQVLVLDWLRRLPEAAIVATPVLALLRAWARFVTGDWEGMVPAIEAAADAIDSGARESGGESLRAQLDGIRSWVAYQTGDLGRCVTLADRALPLMPEDGLVPPRIVASALGYGLLLQGDTDAAREIAARTTAQSRRAGDALMESLADALEAQAQLCDGRLSRAAEAYERAVAAGTVGGEPLPSVGIAQVQLAEVLRERDELTGAERTVRTAIARCEEALGLPEWVFEGNVTLARVLVARGDVEGSRRAAEEADRVFEGELLPQRMEPIVGRALGYRVRLLLATGEVERAFDWLCEQERTVERMPDAARRLFAVLRAKTLGALGEHAESIRVADRLLADEGGSPRRPWPFVELALTSALALHALGRRREAAPLAARALRTARPEGFVRLFADEGAPVVELLQRLGVVEPATARYLGRLLAALGADASLPVPAEGLREPLNERELALLRMFAVGRSNREIADELYLSVNTVKWHARNLHAKLGVNRRALAVVRAKELGIL
jgi:LuxR family maltose regulon positive regulatory protein